MRAARRSASIGGLTVGVLLLATLALPGLAFAESSALGVDDSASHKKNLEVCIRPLGKYDKKLLAVGVKGIEYVYGFEVRVLDAEPMPSDAWYEPRKRYRADIILDFLHDNVPADGACQVVVGFTKHDISVTKGEHKDWGIFGLGELGGRTAMVSTYRLGRRAANKTDKAHRTVKVFNHEIGHVLGIPHGGEAGCLMNDAEGTIDAVDAETGLLCEPSILWIEHELGIILERHTKMDWEAIQES